MIILPLYFLI